MAERNLIDYLRDFNRKERFILLDHVLGQQPGDVFRLNSCFRGKLANKLGLEIREDAFVAMDYHLDWIQMAVHLAIGGLPEARVIDNPEIEGVRKLFQANQEDVDLLIAFEEDVQKTHLVMIEAKADTGWTNKQLGSKAGRLGQIFDKRVLEIVMPHFVLMSPCSKSKRKRKIDTDGWPPWMTNGNTAHWLELPLRDGLLRVTRCDASRKSNKNGDSLLVSERKCGRWTSPPF